MSNFDVIIIGAGLGGLTAGARLSKRGKKVLLIEQHNIPGGCATVFIRKQVRMDSSLHEIDGLDTQDIKYRLFNELGIFDKVKFIKVPESIKYVAGNFSLDIPRNAAGAIESLSKAFPDEKKGIVKFHKRIMAIRRDIHRFSLLPLWAQRGVNLIMPFVYPSIFFNMNKSVGSFLDECVNNEQLKAALISNIFYYHDDPRTTSLLYFSTGNGGYEKGGYYIEGGSQNLSNALANIITDNEGVIIYNHLVTKIITENNKAIGVSYVPKKALQSDAKIEYANAIIANAAIPNVANELLPQKEGLKIKKKIKNLELSNSFSMLFLIFDIKPSELGHQYYSTFVEKDNVTNIHNHNKLFHSDFNDKPFVFCDFSQIESKLAPEGKFTGNIGCCDYISDWENLSPEEYKAKKRRVTEILIDRLNILIPGIKEHITFTEMSTPKTIQRYILTPGGVVYGYAQNVKQAVHRRIDVKSPVKNLYFASVWSFPGGGFTGALLSGDRCSKSIK